jgi:ABC-type multidrug transport system ATPase subunit
MEAVIEVRNLVRKFGDLVAVDHVEFQVYQGEVFGFLGPNGAGKTTTVRMLTGVIDPFQERTSRSCPKRQMYISISLSGRMLCLWRNCTA